MNNKVDSIRYKNVQNGPTTETSKPTPISLIENSNVSTRTRALFNEKIQFIGARTLALV